MSTDRTLREEMDALLAAIKRDVSDVNTQAEKPEVADFADPVAAARSIVATHYMRLGQRRLHYWQGEFHDWTGAHYACMPLDDVRAQLYREGSAASAKPLKKRTVDDVLDALRAEVNLSTRQVPTTPAWLQQVAQDPPARDVIPLANGLLQIDTRRLLPPTPRYFTPYSLPIEHRADTPSPEAWIEFLGSIWPDDFEAIAALQEWMGYLLTADTSLQKALLIVGPKRSGKGTIARIIGRLLGDRNVASPSLASLGERFGLECLIGKTLCLLSDARLGAHADIAAIAENLLRITGEDAISVPRKHRVDFTARLLTRIVALANEVPTFRDAASALPSRFVILKMEHSFIGREDHQLEAKLTAELPGILAWALDGLQRLRQRGHFVQPKSGKSQVQMMQELASPIAVFLRETCVVDASGQVPIHKLYQTWREWCRNHGRDQPGTEQTFGRDVAAAVPALQQRRPWINGARVRMYFGLRLRTPDDPDLDDEDDDE